MITEMMCFALDDTHGLISMAHTLENMSTFVTSKLPFLTHFKLSSCNTEEKSQCKIHEFITF